MLPMNYDPLELDSIPGKRYESVFIEDAVVVVDEAGIISGSDYDGRPLSRPEADFLFLVSLIRIFTFLRHESSDARVDRFFPGLKMSYSRRRPNLRTPLMLRQ